MILIDRTTGTLYIRRSEYIWRSGKADKETARRMGDGDIILRFASFPDGYQDLEDAIEIIAYVNARLEVGGHIGPREPAAPQNEA